MSRRIHELHDKRARLVREMRELQENAAAESREMSSEEDARFSAIDDDVERLGKEIENLKKIEEREADLVADQEKERLRRQRTEARPEELAKRHEEAFVAWVTRGMEGLNHEQRGLMQKSVDPLADVEMRALGTGIPPGTTGGYKVPEAFQRELEKALLLEGSWLGEMRTQNTSSGAPMPWPTVNDTTTRAQIIDENTQVPEGDPAYDRVVFGSYMYSTLVVRVSFQLLQDSAFDTGAHLRDLFIDRLERGLTIDTTTGNGTSAPQGVTVAAADSGQTLTAAEIPKMEDLIDIFHTVDPSYREKPGFRWMFNDDTLRTLKKVHLITGTTVAPEFAWQRGVAPGAPDTILGKPYIINQRMPNKTGGSTGDRFMVLGDMKKYVHRLVRPFSVMRLTERYADYLQVGFIGYSRHDGKLIDAGTNPIKYVAVGT